MINCPVPHDRLEYFLRQVGITPESLAPLEPHRGVFVAAGEKFGREFYEYFEAIAGTRLILEHSPEPRRLERVLAQWFRRLFERRLDAEFMEYLWSSGVRHVEVSLDQRYVNLGYAMARQFCHRLIASKVPQGDREPLAAAVDMMLDFCVLVATDSFVSCTSRCDREVIAGIAHQVRNPITVIGGNITRLARQVDKGTKAHQTFEVLLAENRRLERMVRDIGTYTRLFQAEPLPRPVRIKAAVDAALETLHQADAQNHTPVELELPAEHSEVLADPQELEVLFYHLLENALEAVDGTEPLVRVNSGPGGRPTSIRIEVFNTGRPPEREQIGEYMNPFHSSKPQGTGFGLPIAALVARRNLGSLSLQPAKGGTRCLVELPRP